MSRLEKAREDRLRAADRLALQSLSILKATKGKERWSPLAGALADYQDAVKRVEWLEKVPAGMECA